MKSLRIMLSVVVLMSFATMFSLNALSCLSTPIRFVSTHFLPPKPQGGSDAMSIASLHTPPRRFSSSAKSFAACTLARPLRLVPRMTGMFSRRGSFMVFTSYRATGRHVAGSVRSTNQPPCRWSVPVMSMASPAT